MSAVKPRFLLGEKDMTFEFDLQRFEDDADQAVSAEPTTEESGEEKPPIPEELNGLPEDIARETMEEWEDLQAEEGEESTPASAPASEPITREAYQAKVNEAERLKAQLAEYQNRQRAPQPPPQFQPPPIKITPEISQKINQAVEAEAKNISGMSDDDVASLDYADDDDPRLAQWAQAKSIAQNNILSAVRQAQIAQQYQMQQIIATQTAAVNTYNEFAQKEFKNPDFQAIKDFATNEFFDQLSPNEQRIIANSYVRIERQTASPAEMLVIKNYFEKAKAAFKRRGKRTPERNTYQPASTLPRVDQVNGSATTSDGQLSPRDIEKLLEGDFTKIDPKRQKQLLALT